MPKIPHCSRCNLMGPDHPTVEACLTAYSMSRKRGVKKLRALKNEVRALKTYIAALTGKPIDRRRNHLNKNARPVIPVKFVQPPPDNIAPTA